MNLDSKPEGLQQDLERGPERIFHKVSSHDEALVLVKEFWEANAPKEQLSSWSGEYGDQITYGTRTAVIDETDGSATIMFSGNGTDILPKHWKWLKEKGIK